jgi:hypothetical protein
MKIEIVNRFTAEGREYVEWDLWDGPADSQDHAHGYATDLITSFSKLLEWRERILADYTADYAKEIQEDLDTLKNFLSNNETDI